MKRQHAELFQISINKLTLVLAAFVDGLCPYDSGGYSIWVIVVVIMNLPPKVNGRRQQALPPQLCWPACMRESASPQFVSAL